MISKTNWTKRVWIPCCTGSRRFDVYCLYVPIDEKNCPTRARTLTDTHTPMHTHTHRWATGTCALRVKYKLRVGFQLSVSHTTHTTLTLSNVSESFTKIAALAECILCRKPVFVCSHTHTYEAAHTLACRCHSTENVKWVVHGMEKFYSNNSRNAMNFTQRMNFDAAVASNVTHRNHWVISNG